MKIWKGKLILNGERKKPGPEVEARIIHAPSWLRALGETGTEVG
jgi:hypothetical protein